MEFRRTSGSTFQVDVSIRFVNASNSPGQGTCFYLVPPESRPLSTSVEIPLGADNSVTGAEIMDAGAPDYNYAKTKLVPGFSSKWAWLYEQQCSWDAASGEAGATSSREWGARFTVPETVLRRTDQRNYEIEFDLSGIDSFAYTADTPEYDLEDIVAEGARFNSSYGVYSVDGNGWSVAARPPAGHQVVAATSTSSTVGFGTPDATDAAIPVSAGNPSFTVTRAGGGLPLTLIQVITTLLLGVVVDRAAASLWESAGGRGDAKLEQVNR